MKKTLLLCLALLLCVGGALGEDGDWDDIDYAAYCDVAGDTLWVREGVTAMGSCYGDWVVTEDGDYDLIDPTDEEKALFENGLSVSLYWDDFDSETGIRNIHLPASLRILGCEAIVSFRLNRMILPATIEKVSSDAFLYCTFDTLRIECAVPWWQLSMALDECRVKAYEVPDGHPLYKTIDGVLFSADGKTLISYPNYSQAAHYDVPPGVERIGERAIRNEYLRTVSLPVGLKAVEDYAFSGCNRLQAVSLPLTVEEIGQDVFHECVSLELVSLPEGMTADRTENSWWVQYYPNDRIFRGDNGDTYLEGEKPEHMEDYSASGSLYEPGRLVGRGQAVPLYDDDTDTVPSSYLPDGAFVFLTAARDGRARVADPFNKYDENNWLLVDISQVEFAPGQTLFSYADIRPKAGVRVWWGAMPSPGNDLAPDGSIPVGRSDDYYYVHYGPMIVFTEYLPDVTYNYACRVQDAVILREGDGTDSVYGVVFSEDIFSAVPLLSTPGGETAAELTGGTQIKILEEKDGFCRVTTGLDEGWAARDSILIVPEKKEGN